MKSPVKPAEAALSPIEKVQAEFLAEIAENGVEHSLNWIGNWYIKAAEARLAMELANMPAYEHELFLTKEMTRLGQGAASYSTGTGPNEAYRARIAACSAAFERVGYGHVTELRQKAQLAYLAEANSQPAPEAAA